MPDFKPEQKIRQEAVSSVPDSGSDLKIRQAIMSGVPDFQEDNDIRQPSFDSPRILQGWSWENAEKAFSRRHFRHIHPWNSIAVRAGNAVRGGPGRFTAFARLFLPEQMV